jgi:hypothetical protein
MNRASKEVFMANSSHKFAVLNHEAGQHFKHAPKAEADWLKETKMFDAVVPEINIEGTELKNITLNFPKGSAPDEKTEK